MTDSDVQLKQTLKGQGLNLTRTRQAIFSALQQRSPLSMNALVRAVSGQADRATVYRTVELFERLEIIQRLQIGWKYRLELSDAFHRHHHHLACLHCGRVIHFDEDPALERRLQAIAGGHGFAIQDHQLEIQGLCRDCRKS